MGNAGSQNLRERPKSGSTDLSLPNSPVTVNQNHAVASAFVFDKKADMRPGSQSQEDDDEPYYTKPVGSSSGINSNNNNQNLEKVPRQRSNTISEGTKRPSITSMSTSADDSAAALDNDALPTVFKWDGGGKQVYISGTFSNWKALPMVKSHKDFVTIVDLPEGDHQYKFFVDGEWRHDPKIVSSDFQQKINNK